MSNARPWPCITSPLSRHLMSARVSTLSKYYHAFRRDPNAHAFELRHLECILVYTIEDIDVHMCMISNVHGGAGVLQGATLQASEASHIRETMAEMLQQLREAPPAHEDPSCMCHDETTKTIGDLIRRMTIY